MLTTWVRYAAVCLDKNKPLISRSNNSNPIELQYTVLKILANIVDTWPSPGFITTDNLPLSCLWRLQQCGKILRLCRLDIAGCHSQLLGTQCYSDSVTKLERDNVVCSAVIPDKQRTIMIKHSDKQLVPPSRNRINFSITFSIWNWVLKD